MQITFTLHPNGTTTNLQLLSSAASNIGEQSAIKAVENSAPFRPLPSNFTSAVEIEVVFEGEVNVKPSKTTMSESGTQPEKN